MVSRQQDGWKRDQHRERKCHHEPCVGSCAGVEQHAVHRQPCDRGAKRGDKQRVPA
jgi:hypothetical protein